MDTPIPVQNTCGEKCPFLKEYEHPFFGICAWCEYMTKELDCEDYWKAACKTN